MMFKVIAGDFKDQSGNGAKADFFLGKFRLPDPNISRGWWPKYVEYTVSQIAELEEITEARISQMTL